MMMMMTSRWLLPSKLVTGTTASRRLVRSSWNIKRYYSASSSSVSSSYLGGGDRNNNHDDNNRRDDPDRKSNNERDTTSTTTTTTTNAELTARRNVAIARGVGMMTQVYAGKATNAELWDVEGNRYLDFASGIAVVNTGHRHPKIIAAVAEQLVDKFTHTCHQVAPYENYVSLAERLNGLVTPSVSYDKKTIFVTTGAEAVENAIKMSRAYTGRDCVLSFAGGFHGRTFMGMSVTGKMLPYKAAFGSMMPNVYHVPFPVPLHGVSVDDSIRATNNLFRSSVSPSSIAAIIFEPVQGEGGFYPAPIEFVEALRKLCDEHGIVLVADEVQTGFARTGKLLAMEHYPASAQPDLTTMAKGLAGGLPLAAVTGRGKILDAADPGGLGGTFAGNPLGIAAAHAVLDVIDEEKLCDRARILGDKMTRRLLELQTSSGVRQIAEIRGPGLMVAVEFWNNPTDRVPDANFCQRVKDRALRRGRLILLTCGVHGNVIRMLPPLTIPEDHFDEALDILVESIVEEASAAATAEEP